MIILERNQFDSFEANARNAKKNTLLLTTNGHTLSLSLTQSQSPVATRLKHITKPTPRKFNKETIPVFEAFFAKYYKQ